MDSNSRDESRNRRREEALSRRLAEALDQVAPRGTEPCPDAELIAAYREQALGPEEAANCEMHFAACSRCRKILAVLAASADTPLAELEVARLGELVAASSAPRSAATQTAKPARPKLRDWRVRWLAPALGVAAVLAVWFAMRPPWHNMDQNSSGTLVAQAPKNEPPPPAEAPPADQFSKAMPAKKSGSESATPSRIPKEQSDTKTESAKPAAAALAKKSLDDRRATNEVASRATVAESASAGEVKEQAGVSGALAGVPPPAPAPPAAQPPRPPAQAQSNAAGQAATPAPEMPASTAPSGTVTGGASAAETAGGAADNALSRDKQAVAGKTGASNLPVRGGTFQGLTAMKAARETSIQIRTPSGKIFWRVGKNGSIERSSDTGNAWIAQTSPLPEEWLAGAAASDSICWIVGRNGSIARTTDGEHWEKIVPPPVSTDASGKMPDWINVTASGAQTATITASDQRRFTTQDGGKTWRAQ